MFNQKILCLGNNSSDTDVRTNELAKQDNTVNYGLCTEHNVIPIQAGYYHTSLTDMPPGQVIKFAQNFDLVVLLDQPMNEWSHWKPLLTTYKAVLEIEETTPVEYKNNKNIKQLEYWNNYLKTNPSFCLYPWVLLTEDAGQVNLCARSHYTIANNIKEVGDFKTSEKFQEVRESMLKGKRLPKHCKECYYYEDKGIESSRLFETMDWAVKLGLESIDDLEKLEHPHYYEIRLSNKCNIMCRSCKPEHSHLIDKEYTEHNIKFMGEQTFAYSNFDHVNLDALNDKTRIYLTGGEPSVMAEFYDFMQKCIDIGKTDFDFTIGTNAQSYTPKFWKLVNQFSNMNFTVSVDGYGRINDYQRWLSDFDTVMANAHALEDAGHSVTFLIVPGMYNVTNLHLLLEYLDEHFPKTALYLQINRNSNQSAYNHPNAELVIESMRKCQQTQVYHSDGRSCKTTIDSILDYYLEQPTFNPLLLANFFTYNDQLDKARGVQLKDYIPELDECRKYLK